MNPGRRVILSDSGNFPSDLYMADGLVPTLGRGYELRISLRKTVRRATFSYDAGKSPSFRSDAWLRRRAWMDMDQNAPPSLLRAGSIGDGQVQVLAVGPGGGWQGLSQEMPLLPPLTQDRGDHFGEGGGD